MTRPVGSRQCNLLLNSGRREVVHIASAVQSAPTACVTPEGIYGGNHRVRGIALSSTLSGPSKGVLIGKWKMKIDAIPVQLHAH